MLDDDATIAKRTVRELKGHARQKANKTSTDVAAKSISATRPMHDRLRMQLNSRDRERADGQREGR